MNYLDNLPNELLREIIFPFSYNPQPVALCEDIRNFYEIRKIVFQMYTERYSNTTEDKYEWISNDLTRYMNKDYPTLFYGYHEFYIDKIRRLFLMRDDKKTEESIICINSLIKLPLLVEINLRLALLLPQERILLVRFMRFNA